MAGMEWAAMSRRMVRWSGRSWWAAAASWACFVVSDGNPNVGGLAIVMLLMVAGFALAAGLCFYLGVRTRVREMSEERSE